MNGGLTVTDTTESIDINSGSIITDGGVGIAKNLNVGGSVASTGLTVNSGTVNFTGSTVTAGSIASTAISGLSTN